MPRRLKLLSLVLLLALVQLACNLPTAFTGQITPMATTESTLESGATATVTLPPVITATPGPGETPGTPASPTATQSAGDGSCTYKITFLGDVTIPDNTVIPAGQTFVKTWRVRNDGTCSWGSSGNGLHSLAFTSGDQLGAPNEVALPQAVKPGDTLDISVTMAAPTTNGTYTSNWLFRVDGDPSGRHWVGIGASGNEPLYALIKVGSSSTAAPTRLSFAAGATSIAVSGSLTAGQSKGYILAALKDQVMMATLASPASDVTVKIVAADHSTLTGYPDANNTTAMAMLPSSQDYYVWVNGGTSNTTYSMNITIPSRITFDPGATSASESGQIKNHMTVSYVMRALAGQTLTVTLTGNNIGLTIWGLQDGQPLVRAVSGATSFNRKLTVTQDYIIEVVPAVDSTTFGMTVTAK